MINFQGKEYLAREISIDMKEYVVSIDTLDVALMTKDGSYVSDEARAIDEGIFFYVPEDKIELDEEALAQYVKEEIAA